MNQIHPIEGLMTTAMEQLKHMIDVNTIIGDPIQSADGSTIITVSKVGFGFAAGGSEFSPQGSSNDKQDQQDLEEILPFGGGSGGGATITPIAFLVVHKQGLELVHLHEHSHLYEKLVDVAPIALEKIKEMLESKKRR
ncbi:sporulation protein YtfJ [Natronobacillus azotifigens]|uniref:GerW family sporulation protein n=1 Tax=Natronobacillus azotifigens TaxID=472978 RepID=A0A9J6RBY5_9BACI|nr:GerW family sporulation protein [Natronobacillus azotifigens]MCZ0703202.1 GerW family sporulation protein [Natronobacillus azotifigens]